MWCEFKPVCKQHDLSSCPRFIYKQIDSKGLFFGNNYDTFIIQCIQLLLNEHF